MSQLFSPWAIGPLQLRNRVVIAPMCQYSACNGMASDWHAMHLGNLAQSGAGLLILEATAVEPIGRITHADLGLWNAGCEAALARVVRALRRYSSMPLGIQLAHAGRKASSQVPWHGGGPLTSQDPNGWATLSASALPFHPTSAPPMAARQADIDRVIDAFVAGAKRAARLGFELVELHAAHGYLLHQFLSPLSNRRTDAYGGSLKNRMRLCLQVFDAMRAALPDSIALGVRISATDWVAGGWDLAQSIDLAVALDARGCQYIHVSSGGLSPQQALTVEPGYQLPFAQAIRKQVVMPVIAVGMITGAEQAESIVRDGQADAVALARAMLYDPRWPWHAAAALGATVGAAAQYLRCEPVAARGLFADSPA